MRKHALVSFSFSSFVFTYILFVWHLFGITSVNILLNSDSLYTIQVVNGLLNRASLYYWSLPGAIPVFPDIPILFMMRWMGFDTTSTIGIFTIIQYTLFVIGLFLLVHESFHDKVISSIALIFAAVFPYLWTLDVISMIPALMWTHFNTVTGFVWSAWLTLRFLRTEHYYKLFFLFVITWLIAAFDLLFVSTTIIPIGITILFLAILRKIPIRTATIVIALLIGVVLTSQSVKPLLFYFNATAIYSNFNITRFDQSLHVFTNWVNHVFVTEPYLIIVWSSFIFCLATVIFFFLVKRAEIQLFDTTLLFLASFLGLSIVSSLAVSIITGDFVSAGKINGEYVDVGPIRYIFSSVIFPLWFGWIWVIGMAIRYLKNKYIVQKSEFLVIAAINCFSVVVFIQNPQPGFTKYYPDYVRCLDQNSKSNGLVAGIADYWIARKVLLFSQMNLDALPVNNNLSAFIWNDIRERFLNRIVNFAIVSPGVPDAFQENTIIARYGTPSNTFQCGEYKVLVYNRSTDTTFQHMFDGDINLAFIGRSGDQYIFYAKYLPSQIGQIINMSRIAQSPDPQGFLTFGPYLHLNPGNYAFTLSYSAGMSDGNHIVGTYDVINWSNSNPTSPITLLKGDISNDQNQVNQSFTTQLSGEMEIRIFYLGKGILKVDTLTIFQK